MKYFIANTDHEWYKFLKEINPEDINFWQPGGKVRFKAIEPGSPFLLKLKSPINKVAGIGFFASHSIMPIDFAWEVFQNRNGTNDYLYFKSMIDAYRNNVNRIEKNPNIGCIILTSPVFFNEEDWIDPPKNWSRNIVQGKTYNTIEGLDRIYWNRISAILKKYDLTEINSLEDNPSYSWNLQKVRIGQGAFRVMVTDAYSRRCSISGEKTLPVLEAAHIKPYSSFGINTTNNGLLLRSDLHKLFDKGYITVTPEYNIEISRRIKEEYENGRDYYRYHGNRLMILPDNSNDLPQKEYLSWHNENIYRS